MLHTYASKAYGELAEWLRSGLQIRAQEFDSPTRLHIVPGQ